MSRTVILLHGLGRTRFSMYHLAIPLTRAGFKCLSYGYPSRCLTIAQQSERLYDFITRKVPPDTELYFVGHSLGAIITRSLALAYGPKLQLRRAVLLGPPNQGSTTARTLQKNKIIKRIMGPAFCELASLRLEAATDCLEIGIIAGSFGQASGPLPFLREANDIIVTLPETTLPGAKDYLVVKAMHSFIMYHPTVIRQTINFLQHGFFSS